MGGEAWMGGGRVGNSAGEGLGEAFLGGWLVNPEGKAGESQDPAVPPPPAPEWGGWRSIDQL
jgi:hypothetical protein